MKPLTKNVLPYTLGLKPVKPPACAGCVTLTLYSVPFGGGKPEHTPTSRDETKIQAPPNPKL
jgi:hypothetical protein